MNIYGSIIRTSVMSLLMISNTVSFGMVTIASLPKPQYKKNSSPKFKAAQSAGFERSQGRLKFDKDKSTKLNECLDCLDKLMPIWAVTIPDAAIAHLSDYDQLNILNVVYSGNQKKIDRINSVRCKVLLSLPPDEAKERIFSELKKMREELDKNENDSLNKIKHAYNIDSEMWNDMLDKSHVFHTLNIESMKQKKTNTVHDPNLPENWVNILTNIMQENGLEPSAFNRTIVDKSSTVASYRSCQIEIDVFATGSRILSLLWGNLDHEKESIIVFRVCKAGTIKFNPNNNFGENHDLVLKHVASHELTHGLRGHAAKIGCTINTVARKTGLDEEEIKRHPAFVTWLLAQEISADALGALKSSELARCSKKAPCLYAGSYYFIARAHTNWKVLKLLEERERQALEKEKEPYRTFIKAITANYQKELEAHKKEKPIAISPQAAAKDSYCTLF